jgi:hypothetical protein
MNKYHDKDGLPHFSSRVQLNVEGLQEAYKTEKVPDVRIWSFF